MSTTDASIPDCTQATPYFVVALKSAVPPDKENIVKCLYFDAEGQYVETGPLETSPNSNCIQFVDPGTDVLSAITAYLTAHGKEQDTDVSLFAAVAKTFGASLGLPPTFVASEDESTHHSFINIPVAPGTTRGVVLVFRTPSAGGTDRIIATADPEIRNGSGRAS